MQSSLGNIEIPVGSNPNLTHAKHCTALANVMVGEYLSFIILSWVSTVLGTSPAARL